MTCRPGVVAAKMKVSYGANALEVFVVLGVKDGAELSNRQGDEYIVR
jgi:hypothetical protein